MLLYDWKKIWDYTDGNVSDCVLIFKMMTKNLIPQNRYDRLYRFRNADFRGHSFLVHPDVLLFHSYKYTQREIAQYLALASLRSLAEYYASGVITLSLIETPINIELFEDNRLLRIENGIIHFIYEEVPQEKH